MGRIVLEDDFFSGIESDQILEDDDEELSPEQVAEFLANKEADRFKSAEPVPYKFKTSKKRIAVVDSETDPFSEGVIVAPFCIGFDTGDSYVDFWGDDCVQQFFDYLATLDEEFIIYAHNGGKFDFFFFLEQMDIDQSPLIMNGRLVKISFAKQEFRDSFSIIPQRLSAYKKDEIDYQLFTRDKREKHKKLIREYLRTDCKYTMDLILGFHDMFGDKLTIASASLPMLNSFTGFDRFTSLSVDETFRKYYFGGRNQCFETGVLKGNWKLYDRNSMYPAVMRDVLHPVSATHSLQNHIDKNTDFACIEARNFGALPYRNDDGSLDFTKERGTFFATVHEIEAGLDTGTLIIERVKHAWAFDRKASFGEFVDRFYALRMEAKSKGDKVRDILYKFCLNSGYGKFALDPRKFKQYTMTIGEVPEPQATPEKPEGWSLHCMSGDLFIWERPSPRKFGLYNIATAASITGAARANLLRNISLAKRPIYCDTDSIICEDFHQIDLGNQLGQWDLEATGDLCAIAGKKLYALMSGDEATKKASKGVNLTDQEIIRVARGETIIYSNPVPNFKLDGSADFVTRRISRTGLANV